MEETTEASSDLRRNVQFTLHTVTYTQPTGRALSLNTFCDSSTSVLAVCLSVCHIRAYIVFKRQKISTQFLLHTTAPYVSPRSR